jgi:predicted Zn-dependent peptidase
LSALYDAAGPRREPAWGRPAVVETITQPALRAFAQRHVTAATIRLVLAGALDVPRVRAEVARGLGVSLPSGPPRPSLRGAASPRGGAQWAEKRLPQPGKSQDDLRVVWPGDRSKPWDVAATDLLLYLLGETGYAGRLGDALVDSGLAYSVYATREEVDGLPGFLMVRTASAPKDTPEVLRRIRALLDEASRGTFTAAELAEAQAYVRGKRSRAREGSPAAARDLLERATAVRPMEPAAVTLDQLNDTARRLFRAGAPVALIAGPPAA